MEAKIIEKIIKFRDERNWEQFHNPKDLAISISIEAAELLEVFQWSGEDLEAREKKEQLKDEIADVIIYCIMLAHKCDFDINEIIQAKLEKNAGKYEVEKSYGNSKKYSELG